MPSIGPERNKGRASGCDCGGGGDGLGVGLAVCACALIAMKKFTTKNRRSILLEVRFVMVEIYAVLVNINQLVINRAAFLPHARFRDFERARVSV
jgi:hypothetical protein